MSCDSSASGAANIDLRGTAFAVPTSNAFALGGWSPLGGQMYSQNYQVVDLTGGGFCGWNAAAPGVNNPFNNNGGTLTLVYRGPAQ